MPRLLNTPVIRSAHQRAFIGPSRPYDMQTRSAIPAQWEAYNLEGVTPTGAIPDAWYGVCHSFSADGKAFEYLCGVEVVGSPTVPAGHTLVHAPAGKWLCASSNAHVSSMGLAWSELYGKWLPELGVALKPSVAVEYYPPAFDGRTGEGGWELWVPIE